MSAQINTSLGFIFGFDLLSRKDNKLLNLFFKITIIISVKL